MGPSAPTANSRRGRTATGSRSGSGSIFGKGKDGFGNRDYLSGVDSAEVITAGRLNGDKGADLVIGTRSGIETYLNKR